MKGNFHARFCSRGGGSDPLVYCNRTAHSAGFAGESWRILLWAAAQRERSAAIQGRRLLRPIVLTP